MNQRLAAALVLAVLLPAPFSAQDSDSPLTHSDSPLTHSDSPLTHSDSPLTLEVLMERMAKTRGVRAHFREHKVVSLLSSPIETEGVLYFVPPDRFARHTLQPARAVLVIDGDALLFLDESMGEQVDLGNDPIVRQFAENFAVLFNGDLDSLRELYRASLRADGDRWELTLNPRSATVREFVRNITLRGQGAALLEMVWVEADGDRTTTSFDEVETNRSFTERELEQAFPLEAAARDDGSAVQ